MTTTTISPPAKSGDADEPTLRNGRLQGTDERPAATATGFGRRRTSVQVAVIFMIITMLPLAALAFAAITLSRSAVTAEVRAKVQASAVLEARTVAVQMSDLQRSVAWFGGRQNVLSALGDGTQPALGAAGLQAATQDILDSDPGFSSAAVVDVSGRLLAISPRSPWVLGQSFAYRDWYKGVVRTAAPYVSTAVQSAAAGRPLVVAIAAPIRSSATSPVVGYLSVGLSLSAIQSFVSGFEQGQSVALTVTDQAGVIVATPGAHSGLANVAGDTRVRRALLGETGTVSVRTPGGKVLSAYTPVPGIGWTVHADVRESKAFAAAQRLTLTVAGIAAGLALILVLGGLLLGRIWHQRSLAEDEVRALNADLEARVLQRTVDLQRANDNLEGFAYSVSHDLRTPLRALSGFSDALVEDYGDRLDETGRDYAAQIAAASEEMGELIDDLLHLSRVSRAEIHLERVDLSALVTDVAETLKRQEPERRVTIVVQDDVWAVADRRLLRSVIENLLGNAWKFTSHRPDARIEFGTRSDDGAAVSYFVRDNGAGFDATYADKLFQPFQRLHTTDEFPGNGIGLASVRRIVERHGGRTWAEGTVDGGATISFTLNAEESP